MPPTCHPLPSLSRLTTPSRHCPPHALEPADESSHALSALLDGTDTTSGTKTSTNRRVCDSESVAAMMPTKGSSKAAAEAVFIELNDLSDRLASFAREEKPCTLGSTPNDEAAVEEMRTNHRKWTEDAFYILKLRPEDHQNLVNDITDEFDKSNFGRARYLTRWSGFTRHANKLHQAFRDQISSRTNKCPDAQTMLILFIAFHVAAVPFRPYDNKTYCLWVAMKMLDLVLSAVHAHKHNAENSAFYTIVGRSWSLLNDENGKRAVPKSFWPSHLTNTASGDSQSSSVEELSCDKVKQETIKVQQWTNPSYIPYQVKKELNILEGEDDDDGMEMPNIGGLAIRDSAVDGHTDDCLPDDDLTMTLRNESANSPVQLYIPSSLNLSTLYGDLDKAVHLADRQLIDVFSTKTEKQKITTRAAVTAKYASLLKGIGPAQSEILLREMTDVEFSLLAAPDKVKINLIANMVDPELASRRFVDVTEGDAAEHVETVMVNGEVEYISRAWYREIPLALQELGQRQVSPEDRRLLQIAAHKTYIIMAHYEAIEERNAGLTQHLTYQIADTVETMKAANKEHTEELQAQIKQLRQQVDRLTASQRGNHQDEPSLLGTPKHGTFKDGRWVSSSNLPRLQGRSSLA